MVIGLARATWICLEEDLGVLEGVFLLLGSRYQIVLCSPKGGNSHGPLGSNTRGNPAPELPWSRAGVRICRHACAHSCIHQAGDCQIFLWTISAECFDFYSLTHSSHLMRIWGFLLSSHLGNWADHFPVGTSVLYLARKWHEVALNFSYLLS